jgi:hypothetical protein
MDVTKIAIKLFAIEPVPPLREFVPVFHRWIQTHAVEDHLLIDVADYAHVIGGPGVVLVASEANFYFDFTDNRPGLLYTRKTPSPGSFDQRLRAATIACLKAAALLEQEPRLAGRLRFNTGELLVRLNDRLLAPNTDATMSAVKPAIDALAGEIYPGTSISLERQGSAENLFELQIKSSSTPALAELLDRLHAQWA